MNIMTPIRSALSFLRRRWKLTLLVLGIGLPILAILIFALSPTPIEYVTEPAARGTLVQLVEANGSVTSDRDIELKFPALSGVVADVYVKEGMTVRAGQRLAALRAGGLGAAVASASASLQSQQAQLAIMRQGARPEDIVVAEAELENKRANLQVAKTTLENSVTSVKASEEKLAALRSQLNTSLAGTVSTVPGAISKNISSTQTALQALGSILAKTDVQQALEQSGVFHAEDNLRESIRQATNALLKANGSSASTVDSAIAALQVARTAMLQSSTSLQLAASTFASVPETSSYTAAERENDKSTISTNQTTVQTALSSLDAALNELNNASASMNTQIVTEQASLDTAKNTRDRAQADILTYEASVKISEAQLQLKKAGNRPEDIAAQEARVRQASAELARAASSYSDTILTAPIDGKITKVNIKKGEFTPSGAAITLLGNSPYRIEMYVSEIDIPKVQLTMSGSIELDAFRGTPMKLRVSEIDPASTDRDGVPKYKIVLDFVYPHTDLKIGMTGDAEIITGQREDVITVPSRAVLEKDDGSQYVRVLLENGDVEERTVTTGLEGSNGEVEVSGVLEGDNVIVLEKK